MGIRQSEQSSLWVATSELPTSPGDPFYARLNCTARRPRFDPFVEGLCCKFYAKVMGRPSLQPGGYFRLLLLGYFEGIDSEQGIAWRASDSPLKRLARLPLLERRRQAGPAEQRAQRVGQFPADLAVNVRPLKQSAGLPALLSVPTSLPGYRSGEQGEYPSEPSARRKRCAPERTPDRSQRRCHPNLLSPHLSIPTRCLRSRGGPIESEFAEPDATTDFARFGNSRAHPGIPDG